jgi:hypothetical protein
MPGQRCSALHVLLDSSAYVPLPLLCVVEALPRDCNPDSMRKNLLCALDVTCHAHPHTLRALRSARWCLAQQLFSSFLLSLCSGIFARTRSCRASSNVFFPALRDGWRAQRREHSTVCVSSRARRESALLCIGHSTYKNIKMADKLLAPHSARRCCQTSANFATNFSCGTLRLARVRARDD